MELNDIKEARNIYDKENDKCQKSRSCEGCIWDTAHCGLNIFLELIQMAEKKGEREMMNFKTPRGLFKGIVFVTEEEARKVGYGYYFTYEEYDVYILHTGEYTCEFGFVKREVK